MSLMYAGDIAVDAAFKLLMSRSSTRLIDVRTTAETTFVGAPDLLDLPNGKNLQGQYCLIEWQLFPSMQKNDMFMAALNEMLEIWQEQDQIAKQDRVLLFLCRSGVRSAYAADIATQLGCSKSYNLTGGFEGDANEKGHRATLSGWKFMGLPWSQ